MKKALSLLFVLLFTVCMIGIIGCSDSGSGDDDDDTTSDTYTVTYDGNGDTGGSVPVDSNSYEEGAIVIVLGNTSSLIKTGYTYAGWKTDSVGRVTNYNGGDSFSMSTSNITLYANWIPFVMISVSAYTNFPTGTDDSGTASVTNAYLISETEVTYELWYTVHNWALSNGYTFANPGMEGNDGTIIDPEGAEPTGAYQEPVTEINWRDAMVWCNALTEWYNTQNGTTYSCVYYTDIGYNTPIRSCDDSTTITYPNPGGQDDPYVKSDANGFRLPTSDEWELAARWRDDSTNTVAVHNDPWFTQGDSASDATTYYNDDTGTGGDPGKSANDAVAVYGYYYDGIWISTGVTKTADVKSKLSNSLGIYDMSGNVWEWCFDWYPGSEGSFRVTRGGSWGRDAGGLRVGFVIYDVPFAEGSGLGFRFARTP
jgi:formylglycine-generating enzyme